MNKPEAQARIEAAERELAAAKAALASTVQDGPSEDNPGYFLTADGSMEQFDPDSRYLEIVHKQGNWFPTREAAELESKRRALTQRYLAKIKELNDGWVPDWSDRDKIKVQLVYNQCTDRIILDGRWVFQTMSNSWYMKQGLMDEIKKTFTDAELKLILTGKE